MRSMRRLVSLFILLLYTSLLHAQNGKGESAFGETMRGSGRIYVVIAVMTTILVGLIIYLIRLDRKIGKLEKD